MEAFYYNNKITRAFQHNDSLSSSSEITHSFYLNVISSHSPTLKSKNYRFVFAPLAYNFPRYLHHKRMRTLISQRFFYKYQVLPLMQNINWGALNAFFSLNPEMFSLIHEMLLLWNEIFHSRLERIFVHHHYPC